MKYEPLAKRPTARFPLGSIISHTLLIIVSLVVLFPFIWMLDTALKPNAQVYQFPPTLLPNPIQLGNFVAVWTYLPFGHFILNSLFVAITGTILVMITSSLAAYAFARLTFPGRDGIFFVYVGTLLIPQAVLVIPEFLIMRYLGWINSYQALIVPGAFTAFGTFLMRQFFKTIPLELEESALIDGASRFRILWNIILPLSRSALGVLGLFTFISFWNNFLWPLIVINTEDVITIPLGLQMFQGQHGTEWSYMMAGATISVLPGIILVLFLQRYLVQGITLTGIGGR
ncbi:carbohydrate ABC transporter permease [Dictyobacter kobayashii]|uniref:Sugar ABC transporter permease n=1 Tax=Dictyobacter kobayashii TaxID=2014872 RepID=A0A402ASA3_9CHLR|nr:carbohydrate ABC transporter permease [Dictyobacter kobayashii]GCE21976.1 sugar ABC transporter permease [Dictyobacter kobayashii]